MPATRPRESDVCWEYPASLGAREASPRKLDLVPAQVAVITKLRVLRARYRSVCKPSVILPSRGAATHLSRLLLGACSEVQRRPLCHRPYTNQRRVRLL